MKTTRLYLIRHGQVVNHHEFRYNGHFDVDITDIGVLQMENLAALTLTDTAIIQLGLAKPEDLIKHDEMQLPKFPTSQSRYEGIVNRTFSLTELADAELLGFLEYVEKCEIHIHDSLASKSYLRPYIAAKSRLEKLQRKI